MTHTGCDGMWELTQYAVMGSDMQADAMFYEVMY